MKLMLWNITNNTSKNLAHVGKDSWKVNELFPLSFNVHVWPGYSTLTKNFNWLNMRTERVWLSKPLIVPVNTQLE